MPSSIALFTKSRKIQSQEDLASKFKDAKILESVMNDQGSKRWVNVCQTGVEGNGFIFEDSHFQLLIESFYSTAQPIAVYRGHSDARAMEKGGEDPPSVAWVRALAVDDGDLWALYELTEEFQKQIEAGNYAFSSVFVTYDYDFKAEKVTQMNLVSIAATNNPAIKGLQALAASQTSKDFDFKNILEKKSTPSLNTVEEDNKKTMSEKNEVEKKFELTGEGAVEIVNALVSLVAQTDSSVTAETLLEYLTALLTPSEDSEETEDADEVALEKKALEGQVATLTEKVEKLSKALEVQESKEREAVVNADIQNGVIAASEKDTALEVLCAMGMEKYRKIYKSDKKKVAMKKSVTFSEDLDKPSKKTTETLSDAVKSFVEVMKEI